MAEPVLIELSRLVLDPRFQLRARMDDAAIADGASTLQNGGKLPPVDVFELDGRLTLVHGFHRTQAHLLAGLSAIEAMIHEGTEQEALAFAAAANVGQKAVRLTSADAAKAAEALLLVFSDEWSLRKIADHVGSTHPTVSKIYKRMIAEGRLQAPEPDVDGVESVTTREARDGRPVQVKLAPGAQLGARAVELPRLRQDLEALQAAEVGWISYGEQSWEIRALLAPGELERTRLEALDHLQAAVRTAKAAEMERGDEDLEDDQAIGAPPRADESVTVTARVAAWRAARDAAAAALDGLLDCTALLEVPDDGPDAHSGGSAQARVWSQRLHQLTQPQLEALVEAATARARREAATPRGGRAHAALTALRRMQAAGLTEFPTASPVVPLRTIAATIGVLGSLNEQQLEQLEHDLAHAAQVERARREQLARRLEEIAPAAIRMLDGSFRMARGDLAHAWPLGKLDDLEQQLGELAEMNEGVDAVVQGAAASPAEQPVDDLVELRAKVTAALNQAQAEGAEFVIVQSLPWTIQEAKAELNRMNRDTLERLLGYLAQAHEFRQGQAKAWRSAPADNVAEDLDDEKSDQDGACEDLDDEERDQADDEAREDLEPGQATAPATAASLGARQQVLFTGRGPFTLQLDAPEGHIRAALAAVQARCKVGLADSEDLARRVRAALDEAATAASAIGRTLKDLAPEGTWWTEAVTNANSFSAGDHSLVCVKYGKIEVVRAYPWGRCQGQGGALQLTLRERS